MIKLARRGLLVGVSGLFVAVVPRVAATPATPFLRPVDNLVRTPVSLLIQNNGQRADALVAAATPVARDVVLHATHLQQGEREMYDVPEIALPARTLTSLEPGAAHLMLIGLQEDLVQGHTFPLSLRFQEAGEATVQVRVRRKQDAAGVTPTPPVTIGALTILHASAPPTSVPRS